MSSPKVGPIAELIARFLALHESKNNSEIARATGIDQSQIARWRRGEYSTRLQEETRKKLVRFAGAAEPEFPRRVSESSPPGWDAPEAREYYRGKQDTLLDVMRWVVDQQAQIGRYLRADGSPPPTPSVDEAAAAEAILDQLPKPHPQPGKKKRRA